MPSTFPSNPQNGDAHANNGKKYIYDGDRGVWIGRGRVDTIDPGESSVTQFTAQTIIPSEAGTDLGSPAQRFGELYLSGNSIFLGDKVLRESNVIDINTSVQPETLEIQVDATGVGHAPNWLWTWEQTTLPFARLSITNSTQISVPLYQQSTYVINNYANSLHGDMTQTHSFKLKWIEGAGDDNLVDWVTYTTADDSHPDIDEGNTHTVQRLSFTIPASIVLPTLVAPNVTYTVANDSAGAYTFSGTQSGNNPQLGPFYRGGTYTINIDATGHPFYFTTDNGTGFVAGLYVGEYTTGVTGSRTESGTITFTVPQDAPDTLYYQCGNHAVMRGVIPVRDLAVEQNSNGNYIIYGQHSQDGHSQRIEIRPLPELASQMCLVYDAASETWQPQDLATYVENTPSFENKIKEVAGTATLVAPDGTSLVASVEIYSIESYLPLVDNTRGDIAFAQDTNKLYIWDGTQWITAVADGAASGTGGSSVTMSDTAPAEPSDGDMWYDTTEMNMFVYYADDTSSQWVQVATSASDVDLDDYATTAYVDEQLAANPPTSVTMSDTAPAEPSDGDMWYDTTEMNLFVYYADDTSSQWVQVATSASLAANPPADPITITDVTPTNFDGAAGTSFTVTGTGFTANTTAVFTGTNGAEYATGSVSYLSSTGLAISNLNNLPVDNEPYRVKLTESGTSISSAQTIDAGSVPSFTTPSGLLVATTQWDEAIDTAVVASDADGAITGYTVSAGSLPTGVELNATTGAITGTSVAQATTTHTFEIEATDETGNTNSRQYDIQIQNAAPVWSSPAEGGTEETGQNSAASITLNASDPEGEAISYTASSLPTGLSITGNTISGTPTVVANTSVAVTASDGFASSVRNFFINVLILPLYDFTSHTFTHAGGSSRTPAGSSSFINSVSSESWYDSQYYSVSDGKQRLTVPYTGTFQFELLGAQGGASGSNRGGYGARLVASIPLTQGDVLEFLIGHHGGVSPRSSGGNSGSGGGASFVRNVTTDALLMVSGAGGGASGPWSGYTYTNELGVDASLTTTANPPSAPSGARPSPVSGPVGGINRPLGAGPGAGWSSDGSSEGATNGAGPGVSLQGSAYGGTGGDGSVDGGFGGGGGGRNVIGGGGGGYQGGSCAADQGNSAAGGGGSSYSLHSLTTVDHHTDLNGSFTLTAT